ncbi:MAG TPA: acetate--CoA ligase family protein, partial [Chloroflexota bacterium]|nr:acetate--CoA ligase family protein [Chloroflexota bacterium]
VVTGQAGPGIVIADVLRAAGMSVPALGEATRARIAELLPPMTFTGNPIDTGRPSEAFLDILRAVAADPAIGAVVVYQLVEPALDLRAVLGQLARECDKPILLASGGPAAELEALFAGLSQLGVACYPAPERAAAGAIALVQDARARRQARRPAAISASAREAAAAAANLAEPARRENRHSLYEDEAKQLLAVLGFAVPAGTRMATHDGAIAMAASLGYPVVAKLLASELTHKSEAGAVKLNLADEPALRTALGELDEAAARLGVPPAYFIERFLPGSGELILGAKRDPTFGPTVLVGAGGTLAELFDDASVRCAPVGPETAEGMLAELRSAKLVAGYRSAQPSTTPAR